MNTFDTSTCIRFQQQKNYNTNRALYSSAYFLLLQYVKRHVGVSSVTLLECGSTFLRHVQVVAVEPGLFVAEHVCDVVPGKRELSNVVHDAAQSNGSS